MKRLFVVSTCGPKSTVGKNYIGSGDAVYGVSPTASPNRAVAELKGQAFLYEQSLHLLLDVLLNVTARSYDPHAPAAVRLADFLRQVLIKPLAEVVYAGPIEPE